MAFSSQVQQQLLERVFNIGDRQLRHHDAAADVDWFDADGSQAEILTTIRKW